MPGNSITKEAGAVYVTSLGTYYAKPEIDWSILKNALQNNYLSDIINKLKSHIFGDYYDIEVYDPDGNPDAELSDAIFAMMEEGDNNLFMKMQMAWRDVLEWGCSPFNPVWEKNGTEFRIKKLRRLPPETFGTWPSTVTDIFSCGEILNGIIVTEEGDLQCWQTADPRNLTSELIDNIYLIKDPSSHEVAGSSKIVPLVPLINMLDYAWQSQMQKVNRIGAPILFIKVTDPQSNLKRNDIAYANKILQNWGKNQAALLYDNMEIVELNLADSDSALETIEALKSRIKEFFSPVSMISKEGATIGGNDNAAMEAFQGWINGEHRWLEFSFEKLIQQYLDLNGYEDYKGYIIITEKETGAGDLEQKQAESGFKTKCLSMNEVRGKLGAPELTDEELATISQQWKDIGPAPAASPFGGKNIGEEINPEENPPEELTDEEKSIFSRFFGLFKRNK